MMLGRKFRRLRSDSSAVTAVEFAILALPMCSFLIAALELGYEFYAQSIVQGTLNEAARKASLEDAKLTDIDLYVRNRLGEFAKASDIIISAKSFKDFSAIGTPEKITTDTKPLGVYNKGDCFIDVNRNGTYDTLQGDDGLGGAEDVVSYSVSMTYQKIMPVTKLFGLSQTVTISRNTVLRNEPYAGILPPPTVCT